MTVLDVRPATAHSGRREKDSDHYYHPVLERRLTRVSTIISATSSTAGLNTWYAKKASECAIRRFDEIRVLLNQGRKDEAAELISGAATRVVDTKADAGTFVHDVVEALILAQAGAAVEIPELPPHLAGETYDDIPLNVVTDIMADGFLNWVAEWKPQFRASEMTVYNPTLGVAGTLDIIARLDGWRVSDDGLDLTPCPGSHVDLVIDVKTGKERMRYKQQLAAYRRMEECEPAPGRVEPMPHTDAAAILHLRPDYPGGYKLKVVGRDKEAAAWERFRRRVEIFNGDKADRDCVGRVAYPLRADGTPQPPLVADIKAEGGWGQMPGKLLKAFGNDPTLDFEMLSDYTSEELLAVDGIGPKTVEQADRMLRSRPGGYGLKTTVISGKAA